jgi:hypothetical protein
MCCETEFTMHGGGFNECVFWNRMYSAGVDEATNCVFWNGMYRTGGATDCELWNRM